MLERKLSLLLMSLIYMYNPRIANLFPENHKIRNKIRCICSDFPYACVYFKSVGAQQRHLYSHHRPYRRYSAGDGTPSVLHGQSVEMGTQMKVQILGIKICSCLLRQTVQTRRRPPAIPVWPPHSKHS